MKIKCSPTACRRPLSRCLFTALAFFLVCRQAPAQSTLLGCNPTYELLPTQVNTSITLASAFAVGTQNVDVTSVQFLLSTDWAVQNDTTAYIFSNVNGLPGGILASSQRSFAKGELLNDTAGGGFTSYAFGNAVALSAGNTYWVGFGDQGSLDIQETENLSDYTGNSVTPSLSITMNGYYSYPPGTLWGTVYPQTLDYQLEGSVVPEPSCLALSLLGLGAGACRTWLRNGRKFP